MLDQDPIMQVCLVIQDVLSGCMVVAVSSALIFLALSLVGWRSPYRKRRLKRFGISLVAIPVILGAHWLNIFICLKAIAERHESQRIERHNASSLVHVGELAPGFAVIDTGGKEFSISGNRGKVILINFFATWCGPCIAELPHIQAIWERNLNDENFRLLAIGREETEETVQAFKALSGYTLPMAADPQREAYAKFAKEIIPRTYLIGADGNVCFVTTGFDEDEQAELADRVSRELAKLEN